MCLYNIQQKYESFNWRITVSNQWAIGTTAKPEPLKPKKVYRQDVVVVWVIIIHLIKIGLLIFRNTFSIYKLWDVKKTKIIKKI